MLSIVFNRANVLLLLVTLLAACSEGEQTQSQTITEKANTSIESAQEAGAEAVAAIQEDAADAIGEIADESQQSMADVQEETTSTVESIQANADEAITDLEQQAAAATEQLQQAADDAAAGASEAMDLGDKPYAVVDGKISDNAMEGWRTYNGGGCGACHGKGGVGAVGPNLAVSVTEKLSKDEFFDVVTNGRSGTMMRPHKTNKRVMENLENLYVYLLARGDGVLGPGNLIKSPLGN